jgi:PDZ domain-containing protein
MYFPKRVPVLAAIIMVVGGLLALFAPLPFVIIKPGPAQDVLTSTITIKNSKTYTHLGKLFSTSVLVSNPEAPLFGPELIINWVEGDSLVLPRSAIYPKNETSKTARTAGAQEMSSSAESAKLAAINFLIANHLANPADLDKATIRIVLKETGGPSAGLIFALGVVSKLDSNDLIRGRDVAGTGTIDSEGNVGPIGGIDQKLVGAKRAGAKIFLAPMANCSDITRIPKGLLVIPVETLSEAIKVLGQSSGRSVPTCPNFGSTISH